VRNMLAALVKTLKNQMVMITLKLPESCPTAVFNVSDQNRAHIELEAGSACPCGTVFDCSDQLATMSSTISFPSKSSTFLPFCSWNIASQAYTNLTQDSSSRL
jgi:hypothetical protein